MRTLIILAAFLAIAIPLRSQNQLKIGHVDVNEILLTLPARDSAVAILEKERKDFESAYEEMTVIYNKLLDEYQKGLPSFTDLVKKTKEDELVDKQRRITEFEQNATLSLQNRNAELIQPIIDKILKAIDRVARENSLTYVLDKSKGSVVFVSSDSQDLNPAVIKILKP